MGRGQVVRQPVLVLLFGGSNPPVPNHIRIGIEMGRGQVVRQPVLVLLFGGSNPPVPNHIRIKMLF